MKDAKEVSIMEKPKVEHRSRDYPVRTNTSYGTYARPINTKEIIEYDILLWVKCFNNNYTIY
jgi:hypothetical protein